MSQNRKLNSYQSRKTYLNFNQLLNSHKIIKISEDLKIPRSTNCNLVLNFFISCNIKVVFVLRQVSSKSQKNISTKQTTLNNDSETLPLLPSEKSHALPHSKTDNKVIKPFYRYSSFLSPKTNIHPRKSTNETNVDAFPDQDEEKLDNMVAYRAGRRLTVDCPISNVSSPYSRVLFIFNNILINRK